MIATAAIVLTVAAGPASTQNPAQRLSDELLASPTATAVLERRCDSLGYAPAPRVTADVVRGAEAQVPRGNQLRLKAGERVIYRKVRLMCGRTLLSEAENWYIPQRLTPAMNVALDGSRIPFGRVILSLRPSRRTLSIWVAESGDIASAATVVQHRAVVLDGAGRPLAHVVERYQRALIDQPSGGASEPDSRSPSN